MTKNLKILTTVNGMMEAEIIKSKLENDNIPCMLKFESTGKLFGITLNGLGKVEILVPNQYLDSAQQLIKKNKDKT